MNSFDIKIDTKSRTDDIDKVVDEIKEEIRLNRRVWRQPKYNKKDLEELPFKPTRISWFETLKIIKKTIDEKHHKTSSDEGEHAKYT